MTRFDQALFLNGKLIFELTPVLRILITYTTQHLPKLGVELTPVLWILITYTTQHLPKLTSILICSWSKNQESKFFSEFSLIEFQNKNSFRIRKNFYLTCYIQKAQQINFFLRNIKIWLSKKKEMNQNPSRRFNTNSWM